jgi:hypothetical protein
VVDGRRVAVSALLQATSLPFIVASTAIGIEMGLIGSAEASALIAAGLLSVLLFPITALTLLKRGGAPMSDTDPAPAPIVAM